MGYRQRKGHVGAVTAGWREAGACGGDGWVVMAGWREAGANMPQKFLPHICGNCKRATAGRQLPFASLALLCFAFACFAFACFAFCLPCFAFCFLCFAHRFPCFCKIMGGNGWLLGYSLYFCCRKNNNYKTTLSCKQSEPLFLLFFACRPPLAAWPTRNNRRLVSNKRLVVQMPAILSLA